MINKLTQRHFYDKIKDHHKYVIKCPCCGTILNFGKEDIYKSEDNCWLYHKYIDCSECHEAIILNDDDYLGY